MRRHLQRRGKVRDGLWKLPVLWTPDTDPAPTRTLDADPRVRRPQLPQAPSPANLQRWTTSSAPVCRATRIVSDDIALRGAPPQVTPLLRVCRTDQVRARGFEPSAHSGSSRGC